MKTVVYAKYSNERNPYLAIRTEILEDEAKNRMVKKSWEFPEGREHVEGLFKWYEKLSRLTEGTKLSYNRCKQAEDGVELEYVEGENLEEHLLSVLKEQGIEVCAREFLEYLFLVKELHKGAIFQVTEGFREVFGFAAPSEGTECAPCSNIDLVCGNILLGKNGWTVIDYEWSFDFPVPVHYILFRIIFYFIDHAGRGTEFLPYDFYGKMGITKEEIEIFEAMETNFQKYVCRDHVPIRDLYEEISQGMHQLKERSHSEDLQVYFDLGKGFREEDSIHYRMNYKEHWEIQKKIPLPNGVRALRVDPGSRKNVTELRQFSFDNQKQRTAFTLREGITTGDWIYMETDDPNIFIMEIPKGAKFFLADLAVYPAEEGEEAGMANLIQTCKQQQRNLKKAKETIQKQEQTIHAMENTKIWKLYRKYRDKKER